jgi:hypothetical protein
MRTASLFRRVIVILGFAAAAPAAADDPMLDNFSVQLGLYASNISSTLSLNGSNPNGSIDLHRDIDLPSSSTLPFFDLTWRPFERHEFSFNYYSDDESRTRTLARDITIRDKVYQLGAQVKGELSLEFYGIGYRYWWYIGDKSAFGIGGGLQNYSLTFKLTGSAGIVGPNGSVIESQTQTTKASTDIPDPFLGISWRYQAIDWLRVVADLGAFKANISNIDATLYSGRLGLEFYPWERFGIVTQYSYDRIKADLSKNEFSGDQVFRFHGLQVLAKFRF